MFCIVILYFSAIYVILPCSAILIYGIVSLPFRSTGHSVVGFKSTFRQFGALSESSASTGPGM